MPKLRSLVLTLLACLGTTGFAFGQYTTITASSLKLSGSNITQGVVTFTPVDANSIPIVFVDGSGAQNGPTAFSCTVASGAITTAIGNNGVAGGTCVLPDTTMTTPVNVAYNIQVCDTSTGLSTSGKCYVLGGVYGVSGSTWPLDHYGPPAKTVNSQQLQSALGPNVPSTCVAPALFTKSTNAALYTCVANRYIQVLGSSTSSGTTTSYASFNSIATANEIVATDGSANFVPTGLTASNGSLYSTYLNATGAAAVGSLTSASSISTATLSTSGLATLASVVSPGNITGNTLTSTGAATVGSLSTTGNISAATLSTTGAFTPASVNSPGNVQGATVTSTGVATVGSLSSTGAANVASVTATGAVNSATVVASGAITSGSLNTPVITAQSDNSVLNADQFPGVDIGAQINAAFAACPTTQSCKVTLPPGNAYSFSTMVTIPGTLQYTELDCQGSSLTFTGSGDAIQVAQRNDGDPTGTLRNCRIVNGSGNTLSLAAVHQFSRIWFSYVGNTFYGFNNAGGVGIEMDNNAASWGGYNERTFFLNNSFSFDTKGVEFKGSDGGTNSFARQVMLGTKCNLVDGQYCISVEGTGGFQTADIYDSTLNVEGNLAGTNARAVSVTNGGDIRTGQLNLGFEGPNTSYLIYTDNFGSSAVSEAGTLSGSSLVLHSDGTSDQINVPQLNQDFVIQDAPFVNTDQQNLNSKILWTGNNFRYGIPNDTYNYGYFQLFKRATTNNLTDAEVDAEPTTGNTQINMMYCNVGGCGFGPGYGPSATRGGTTVPASPLEVGGSPVCTQASGCPAVGTGSGALYTSPVVNFIPKVNNATSPGTMVNSSIKDDGTTVSTTEALSTGAITAPSASINGSPVCTNATGCGVGGIATVQITAVSGTYPAKGTAGYCSTVATVSMPGVVAGTTGIVPSYSSNPIGVVGWTPGDGMTVAVWASAANTASYSFCNTSPSQIANTGAITFDLVAK